MSIERGNPSITRSVDSRNTKWTRGYNPFRVKLKIGSEDVLWRRPGGRREKYKERNFKG